MLGIGTSGGVAVVRYGFEAEFSMEIGGTRAVLRRVAAFLVINSYSCDYIHLR